MRQKKILFIAAASGLWDRIMIIPKLVDLKKQWYSVTLLCYEPSRFILFYKTDEPFKIYRENGLYDKVLWIPNKKRKIIGFIIRNLWRFNEAYTPINTFFSSLWWRLFAKKYTYSFKNLHDNSKYENIIQGIIDHKIISLYEYKKLLNLKYSEKYKKKFWLQKKNFVTLFVWLTCRSITPKELEAIIIFLNKKWYVVILVWWNREKRILNEIEIKKYRILNLLWKTNFLEISSILSDSTLNISMDGWLMRLGHLMNKNNISIENTTSIIMQPPVDNIHSFNLREYNYPNCIPCIYFCMQDTYRKHWIKKCVFYNTDREGECRFATKSEKVIYLIKKILPYSNNNESLL